MASSRRGADAMTQPFFWASEVTLVFGQHEPETGLIPGWGRYNYCYDYTFSAVFFCCTSPWPVFGWDAWWFAPASPAPPCLAWGHLTLQLPVGCHLHAVLPMASTSQLPLPTLAFHLCDQLCLTWIKKHLCDPCTSKADGAMDREAMAECWRSGAFSWHSHTAAWPLISASHLLLAWKWHAESFGLDFAMFNLQRWTYSTEIALYKCAKLS